MKRVFSIDEFIAENQRIEDNLQGLVETALDESENTETWREEFRSTLNETFGVTSVNDLSFDQKRKYLEMISEGKKVQVKRKYGENPAVNAFTGTPVREKVLAFVNEKGRVSETELREFFKRFNEESGKMTRYSWVSENHKLFKVRFVKEQRFYSLSKLGQQMLAKTTINEAGYLHDSDTIPLAQLEEYCGEPAIYKAVKPFINGDFYYLDIVNDEYDDDLLDSFNAFVRGGGGKKVKSGKIRVTTEGGNAPLDPHDQYNLHYTAYQSKDKQTTAVQLDTDERDTYAVIMTGNLSECNEAMITEEDIKDDEGFKKWAHAKLKKMHGDDYDEAKADKVIDGLLKKKEGDDYGAIAGMLNKA